MAQNNIGNAALILSTQGDALTQGLSSAGSEIKSWAEKTKAQTQTTFGALSSGIGSLLKGGIVGAVGLIGSVIGATIEVVKAPMDRLNDLFKVDKLASTMGIAADQLQGMQLLLGKVGVSAEGTGHVFALMGKSLEDAAQGHGRAAPALKELGIAAATLINLPLDEQLKSLADAISKLPPGAAQAQAAMHIFGESGAQLLPILQKGSAGIQDFVDKAKSSGAILSSAQIKQGADAAKSMKEAQETISRTWEGLLNRITIAVAPIVKVVGRIIDEGFKLLQPWFDWLARYWETIGLVASAVLDVIVVEVKELANDFRDWTKEIGITFDMFPSIQTVVVAVFKAIAEAGSLMWDSMKVGAGIFSIALGYVVKGLAAIWDTMVDLTNKIMKNIPEEFRPTWMDEFIAKLDTGAGKIGEAGNGLIKWGENQLNAWGSSLQKVDAWFSKLGKTAKNDIVEGMKKAVDISKALFQPVELALKGSKEEYTIASKFAFDSKWGNAPKGPDLKLEEQKKANQKLDKIINNTDGMKIQGNPEFFNVL